MADSVRRTLVLHADDLGMSTAVNAGIECAFSHGLLTSASVLANGPACTAALRSWKRLQEAQCHGTLWSTASRLRLDDALRPFDLGIHLNLTQGRPLTAGYPSELLDREGRFPGIYPLFVALLRTRRQHQTAIRAELHEQLVCVRDYGVVLTHANGHQYVEMLPAVAEILPGLLARFGIGVCRLAQERVGRLPSNPLRWPRWVLARTKLHFARNFGGVLARAEILHPDGFRGASHAGRVDLRQISRFLRTVHPGLTEIAVHPGERPLDPEFADGWDDPLQDWRPREMETLTSPALAQLLEREQVRLGRLQQLTAVPVRVPARAA